MPYRKEERNLRQIASELGVAHILEGSVQRSGDRVRVQAQLINAKTDAHLWAAQYDRGIDDVFAVQADIALKVAGAVQARLVPEEKARIGHVPTQNLEAYELYMRAVDLFRQWKPDEVIEKLDRAIALDPQFALAYALLSSTHNDVYTYGADISERHLTAARDFAETALRLDPDLAEGYAARGFYLYGRRNYEAALQDLDQARRLAPGNPWVHYLLGAIHRRQGRWNEAIAGYAAAVRLDPLRDWYLADYARTLMMLRRYAEADRVYARWIAVSPKPFEAKLLQAYNHAHWTGDIRPLGAVLETAPPGPCVANWVVYNYRVARREFQEAASRVLACDKGDAGSFGAEAIPKEIWAAEAYRLAGDAGRARELYQVARKRLDESLRANSDRPYSHVMLAMALAELGDRPAALAEVEKALESMPVTRDAVTAPSVLELAARVHARLGEQERALDELEQVLNMPGPVDAHFLQLNPFMDPLRDHPRFQKLIAEHLPKE
jgi:tetratricopeptide (TPR) repeat protein